MPARTLINERYELEDLPIARGGVGEVWLGRDVKLEREIAVKFIRFPDGTMDKELVRRFVRESRITARLEHPGVPSVYDVGTHDNKPYLVMQRIRGISIADLCAEQGPLPIGWAAAIAAQTCAVLAVAHEASLVHRDLKPGNLMLEPHGGVKVLDFGLAVAIDLADVSKITHTGQTLGTPAYMAPEQIQASMSGPHTDLYALGCTLHEMLTGRALFSGSTAYAIMRRQVDERPRPVRGERPEVPADLDRLVTALLEKKPTDRPASATSVYEQLLPHAADLGPLPGVLTPPTAPSPARMYAGVLSRVLIAESTAIVPEPPRTEQIVLPSLHRSELDRARQDARKLVEQSRFTQAADVLASVVEPASRMFGQSDSEVVSLRLELANLLFEGGDYRRAAPVYHQLAADLSASGGANAEPTMRCRLQEATCNALIGQTTLALSQLNELLQAHHRVYGEDDERTLELRRQIGLLQLGAGQRQAVEKTLTDLMTDLRRVHNDNHPSTQAIAGVLAGLRRTGR